MGIRHISYRFLSTTSNNGTGSENTIHVMLAIYIVYNIESSVDMHENSITARFHIVFYLFSCVCVCVHFILYTSYQKFVELARGLRLVSPRLFRKVLITSVQYYIRRTIGRDNDSSITLQL